MIQRIKEFILQHNMIEDKDRLILGVSGGADSVFLLRIVSQLKEEKLIPGNWDYEIVHVEHGIRGEESLQDANFVKEMARQMGVAVSVVNVDVPAYAKENGLGDEEAARILRYDAFRERARVVNETANAKIVLAHHMEDNAETVIFQMLRGSALKGLCGIMPIRYEEDICYIRPLLCVSRREIEASLDSDRIKYCTDATNANVIYSRNRLRNIVFPEFKRINAQAVSHINQSAGALGEVWDFLSKEVDKKYQELVDKDINGALSVETQNLILLHPAVRNELILRMIANTAGRKKDIGSLHVEAVAGLLDAQSGKKLNLPYEVKVRKEFDRLIFFKENNLSSTEMIEIEKSKIDLDDKGLSICLENDQKLMFKSFVFDGDMEKIPQKPYTKWFDYDMIESSILVRKRQPGDYFINDKNGHKKKLKNFFTDEKIPVSMRNDMWLVTHDSHVIWILGGRISEAFKVTEKTKKVLEVSYIGGR